MRYNVTQCKQFSLLLSIRLQDISPINVCLPLKIPVASIYDLSGVVNSVCST